MQIRNPNGTSRFNRSGRTYVEAPKVIQTDPDKFMVDSKFGPSNESLYVGPSIREGDNKIPHGKDGTIVYSTGHVYKGDFKQGKREGYGTLTIKEGKIKGPTYEGEWKDDKFVPFVDYKKK
jgi:hypothetical protein